MNALRYEEEVPFQEDLRKLSMPPGFKEVVTNLAREVIRDQPKDIYAYAALHFEKILQQNGKKVYPLRAYMRTVGEEDEDLCMDTTKRSGNTKSSQTEPKATAVKDSPKSTEQPPIQTKDLDKKSETKVTDTDGNSAKERLASEEEIDICLSDPDVAKAAVKIQATFRMHRTRLSLTVENCEVKSFMERRASLQPQHLSNYRNSGEQKQQPLSRSEETPEQQEQPCSTPQGVSGDEQVELDEQETATDERQEEEQLPEHQCNTPAEDSVPVEEWMLSNT